jgi:pimeloyl-ACP methyl ester carboxylesterase
VRERFFPSDDGIGGGAAPLTVLCLPGLTRNSRDFAALAQRLAVRHRVLTPDFRGRGRSSWDPNPLNYHARRYAQDMRQLIEQVAPRRLALIGTSLGGIVSGLLAQEPLPSLCAVVLNDIGAEVDPRGAQRIAAYVGTGKPMRDWCTAVAAVRANNELALPGLSEAAWLTFAQALCREAADGSIVFDYDPAIGLAYRQGAGGKLELWPLFAALARVHCVLLRGEHSDVLSAQTVERMCTALPQLRVVEVRGRGHAPLLDEPESLAAIEGLLAQVAGKGRSVRADARKKR